MRDAFSTLARRELELDECRQSVGRMRLAFGVVALLALIVLGALVALLIAGNVV